MAPNKTCVLPGLPLLSRLAINRAANSPLVSQPPHSRPSQSDACPKERSSAKLSRGDEPLDEGGTVYPTAGSLSLFQDIPLAIHMPRKFANHTMLGIRIVQTLRRLGPTRDTTRLIQRPMNSEKTSLGGSYLHASSLRFEILHCKRPANLLRDSANFSRFLPGSVPGLRPSVLATQLDV